MVAVQKQKNMGFLCEQMSNLALTNIPLAAEFPSVRVNGKSLLMGTVWQSTALALWPISPTQREEREWYTWFILPLVSQPLCLSGSLPPPPFMEHMVSHGKNTTWQLTRKCHLCLPACCTEHLLYNCWRICMQMCVTMCLCLPGSSKTGDEDVTMCRHVGARGRLLNWRFMTVGLRLVRHRWQEYKHSLCSENTSSLYISISSIGFFVAEKTDAKGRVLTYCCCPY